MNNLVRSEVEMLILGERVVVGDIWIIEADSTKGGRKGLCPLFDNTNKNFRKDK
jgi:hypothetical protein